MSPVTEFIINDLRLWLHLGCSAEERINRQLVAIDISIQMDFVAEFIRSDVLDDVLCYSKIIEKIRSNFINKQFNLIESLAFEIHSLLKKYLENTNYQNAKIKVKTTKCYSPVQDLHGGASFIIYS